MVSPFAKKNSNNDYINRYTISEVPLPHFNQNPLKYENVGSYGRPDVQNHQSDCDCGIENPRPQQLNNRIVDGKDTNPNQYPWLVHLQGSTGCGGSIISSIHILTAAHCFDQGRHERPHLVEVHVGKHIHLHNAPRGNERFNGVKTVRSIIMHPMYNENPELNRGYDIAIVTLDDPINLDHHKSRPICLPVSQQSTDFENQWAIIAGWGAITSKSIYRVIQ